MISATAEYRREPTRQAFENEIGGDYDYFLGKAQRIHWNDSCQSHEDLLHDSLKRFWCRTLRLGMPESRRAFRGFLINKLVQTKMEHYRSARHRYASRIADLSDPDLSDPAYEMDILAEAIKEERRSFLTNMLARQFMYGNEDIAQTIMLRLKGLPYDEIARMQGIPSTTARYRLRCFKTRCVESAQRTGLAS